MAQADIRKDTLEQQRRIEEEQRLRMEEARAREEALMNQPPAPPLVQPPQAPPMYLNPPSAVPSGDYQELTELPPAIARAREFSQKYAPSAMPAAPAPGQGALTPADLQALSALPSMEPEGPTGGVIPSLGTALKTGVLDVASLMAGAGAMVGEGIRRVTGATEPLGFQQAAFDKYQQLSEQSAQLRQGMNDPWETAKGLFGASDEVSMGQAITRMPATLLETIANQAPFMAMTMGVGGIMAKIGGPAVARLAAQTGKTELLAKRAEKFMLDEAMRATRSQMTRSAWKKADKEAIKAGLKKTLSDDIAKSGVNAYGSRFGLNTGIVGTTGALEAGGMFGEAAEYMGGMDNVSLASTAMLGAGAGMIELAFGGGNLKEIRRILGPRAEREALQIARRAAVADGAEIPGLLRKSTAIMGRVAKASGIEAIQESAQELAAITNLVYNIPESINDIDVLERVGSSAVVGGMMGFGPASIAEFADFKSGTKPPEIGPDGERVDTPIKGQGRMNTIDPANLTAQDIKVLLGFGKKMRDDLAAKDRWTDDEVQKRDFLNETPEGQDRPNYQNPTFILDMFVNRNYGSNRTPLENLKNLYNVLKEKYPETKPEYNATTGEVVSKPLPHEAALKEKEEALKATSEEATRVESDNKSAIEARKERNAIVSKHTKALSKAKNKVDWIDKFVEKHRDRLGDDYDARTKTGEQVILDVVEHDVPIQSTLTNAELAEKAFLDEGTRALASALPAMPGVQVGATAGMEAPYSMPLTTPEAFEQADLLTRAQQTMPGAVPITLPPSVGIQERAEAIAERDLAPEAAAAALDPTTLLGEATRRLYAEGVTPEEVRVDKEGERRVPSGERVRQEPQRRPKEPRKRTTKAQRGRILQAQGEKGKEEELTKLATGRKPLSEEDRKRAVTLINEGRKATKQKPLKKAADVENITATDRAIRSALKDFLGIEKKTRPMPAGAQAGRERNLSIRRTYKETFGTPAPRATKLAQVEEAIASGIPIGAEAPVAVPAVKAEPTAVPAVEVKEEKPAPPKAEALEAKADKVAERKIAKAPKKEEKKVVPPKVKEEKKEKKPGVFAVKVDTKLSVPRVKTMVLAKISDERKKVNAYPAKTSDEKKRKAAKLEKLKNLRVKVEQQNTQEDIASIIDQSSIAERVGVPVIKEEAPPTAPTDDKAVVVSNTIKTNKKELDRFKTEANKIVKQKGKQSNTYKALVKSGAKIFTDLLDSANTSVEEFISLSHRLAPDAIMALPIDKKTKETLVEAKKAYKSLQQAIKNKDYKKEKGLAALVDFQLDSVIRSLDGVGIEVDGSKVTMFSTYIEPTPPTPPPTQKQAESEIDKAEKNKEKALKVPKLSVVDEGEKTDLTDTAVMEGEEPPLESYDQDTKVADITLYDEEGNPVGFSASELGEDVDYRETGRLFIEVEDGDNFYTSRVDLSDLDLIQAGRGTMVKPPPASVARTAAGRETAADYRLRAANDVLNAIGLLQFKRLLGHRFEADEINGVTKEKKTRATKAQLEALRTAEFVAPNFLVVNQVVPMKDMFNKVSDIGARIIEAYIESGETFSSDLLDEFRPISKGKQKGRPQKVATTRVRDYNPRQMPAEIRNNDEARKVYDKERARAAFEWFGGKIDPQDSLETIGGIYNSHLKKATKNPTHLAIINRINKLYNAHIKRGLAKIDMGPPPAQVSSKSAPSRKPSEVEKSMNLWIDMGKAKEAVNQHGLDTILSGLYEPITYSLILARKLLLANKKEAFALHKELSDKKSKARERLRQVLPSMSDEDFETILIHQLKPLKEGRDTDYVKWLRADPSFLDTAISLLRKGTPLQNIHGGMTKAIIDVVVKNRAVTEEDRKNEYAIAHAYLNQLGELAANAGVKGTWAMMSTRKKSGEVDADAAKALGVAGLGYSVRVYKRGDRAFMKTTIADGIEYKGNYGWRVNHITQQIYTTEGYIWSDDEVASLKDQILMWKTKQEAPELDPKYQENLKKIKQNSGDITTLFDRMKGLETAWIGRVKKGEEKKGYVEKQQASNEEYIRIGNDIDKLIAENTKLREANNELYLSHADKRLKQVQDYGVDRAKTLATEVTDEVADAIRLTKAGRNKFKRRWDKFYKDMTLEEWFTDVMMKPRKRTSEDWKAAIATLKDHIAQDIGGSARDIAINAEMEQPFVEEWWKATEKQYPDRPTWKQVNTAKEEKVDLEKRVALMELEGATQKAINRTRLQIEKGGGATRTPMKWRKFNIKEKMDFLQRAKDWDRKRRLSEGVGGTEQNILNAAESVAQMRAAQIARRKGPKRTRMTIAQQLAALEEANKKVKESLKKKVGKGEIVSPPLALGIDLVEADDKVVSVNTAEVAQSLIEDAIAIENGEKGVPTPPTNLILTSGFKLPEEAPTKIDVDNATDEQILNGLAEGHIAYSAPLQNNYYTKLVKHARSALWGDFQTEDNAMEIASTVVMDVIDNAKHHRRKYKESESVDLNSYLKQLAVAEAERIIKRGPTAEDPRNFNDFKEYGDKWVKESKITDPRWKEVLIRERERIRNSKTPFAELIVKDDDIRELQLYARGKMLSAKVDHDDASYLSKSIRPTARGLSPAQRTAERFGRIFGIPVTFVDNISALTGVQGINMDGKIYMDAKYTMTNGFFVFGHEMWHQLEYYAYKNPEFKNKFVVASSWIQKAIKDTARGEAMWKEKVEQYKKEYGVDTVDDELVWSEFKSDLLGYALNTEEFYSALESHDPATHSVVRQIVGDMLKKIASYIKALFDKFGDKDPRNARIAAMGVVLGEAEKKFAAGINTMPNEAFMEIVGSMAEIVKEANRVVMDKGEVKYFSGDTFISKGKLGTKDVTYDNVAKALFDGDTAVVPVLADLANGTGHSIGTIRHNVHSAMARMINKDPQQYMDLYFPARRMLDTNMYPDAYKSTEVDRFYDWIADKLDKKPDVSKDTKITNQYLRDLTGDMVLSSGDKSILANRDANAPAVMMVRSAGPIDEMLKPENSITEWTNSDGKDGFAFIASLNNESSPAINSGFRKLNTSERTVPVYVKSDNPFNPADPANADIVRNWLQSNYDFITEESVDDWRVVPEIFAHPDFLRYLDNLGYDSLIVYHGGPHVVVFNQDQIERASTNDHLQISSLSGTREMSVNEDGDSEIGPTFEDLGFTEDQIEHMKKIDLGAWNFPERAIREWQRKDEVDPNAIVKLGKVFATNKADLKWYHEIIANPWHISELFPKFKGVHEKELIRQEGRMEFIHRNAQSPFKHPDADDTRHEFLALDKPRRIKVTNALQLGDKHNHELTDEEYMKGEFYSNLSKETVKFPKLNAAEMEAALAVRKTLDNIWEKRLAEMKELLLRPYTGTASFIALKQSVNEYIKSMKTIVPEADAIITPEEEIVHPDKENTEAIKERAMKLLAKTDWDDFNSIFDNLTKEGGKVEQIFAVQNDWSKHKGYFPRMRKSSEYIAEIWVGTKDNKEVIWSYRPTTFELSNILKKGPVFEYAQLEGYMKNDPYYGKLLKSGEARFELSRRPQLAEDVFSEISGTDISAVLRGAIIKLQEGEQVSDQLADELFEKVFQQVSEEIKARGFARHSIKRGERFIPGFKTGDGAEMLYDYITGAAGFITKQKASWDFFKALEAIDPNIERKLFRYGKDFVDNMLRNTDEIDAVSSKLRGAMFTMFLAGSLKPVAVNFTQNFVAGIPWLARHTTIANAHKLYFKAMKDVAGIINPIDVFNPKGEPKIDKSKLTDVEWKYLKRAIFQGRTIDQFVRELSESFRTGRTWYHKVANYLARGFSHMEQFNRAAAHLAMFRLAIEEGRTPDDADKAAERFVYNTHYLIGKANIPQWGMGESALARIGGRNALLFRSFTHNYLLSMTRSLEAVEGREGDTKYKAVLLSMGYIALFGGLLSIPFFDDILEELEKLTKKPLRSKARQAFSDSNADVFYNMAVLGFPAAFGVDVSGSMRISMPWGADDAVFGVWGGAWDKLKKSSASMKAGDYYRAVENISPMFLSHPMRAYRSYKQPVTTPSGQVMYDWKREKFQYTSTEAFWRALGFRPAREAVKQMDKRSKDILIQGMKDIRNNIYRTYALAHSRQDFAGMQRAREEARKWNKDRISIGLASKLSAITSKSFSRSLKRKLEGRKEELAD